jgi:hypothetical protein
MSKRTIVKVQIPLNAGAEPFALVYDRSRRFTVQVPITRELMESMNGEPKQFFYADTTELDFALAEVAPWQQW